MPHPNRFTAACGLKGTSASWPEVRLLARPEVRLLARPEVRLRSHVPKVSKSTKACRLGGHVSGFFYLRVIRKMGPGGAASREDAALQLNATNK